MIKQTVIILLLLIVTMSANAQFNEVNGASQFGEDDKEEINDYLGFMLLASSNMLVRFYEIHVYPNGKIKYTQLTMDGFMNRAAGRERSLANPSGKNMFDEYGIKDPNIVSQLWKLRYKEYPYQQGPVVDYRVNYASETSDFDDDDDENEEEKPQISQQLGWANNEDCDELPSKQQFAILSKYGINRVQDLCKGKDMFQLFKDMENPEWQAKYKNSANSSPVSQGGTNEEGETFVD